MSSSYFYKIDLSKNQIKLVNQNEEKYYDLMKYSSLIFTDDNNLLNYNSGVESCISTLAMNKMYPSDEVILGINCFDELLSRS